MTQNSFIESNHPQQAGGNDHHHKAFLVGIGTSLGSMEACKSFFSSMPPNTGMAFVIIVHPDTGCNSLTTEAISRHTIMPVIQVKERIPVKPNHIYIGMPYQNLVLRHKELIPCKILKTEGVHTPVDFFFRSMALEQHERSIGIILSGTRGDGTMGIKEIKEYGGLVIAQSPETEQEKAILHSAISTGMIDFILPIKDMGNAILKFITHPYPNGVLSVNGTDDIEQILELIRSRTNHDFRCYKRSTFIRRMERRMSLQQIERLPDYIKTLENNPREIDSLVKDLWIGVTGFFREQHVWEKLGNYILPILVNQIGHSTPLRIWVAGCSTGEEAYTIAILIDEMFTRVNRNLNVQIFATDIDADAIAVARLGIYPDSIATNVSPERLQKYFIKENSQYHIIPKIREAIVFAVQNLISDAPFSNMDIISCRNMLIYLNSHAQKKVIELFHFALKKGGYLILGSSETIGFSREIFEAVYKELRIYKSIGIHDERIQIPIIVQPDKMRGFGMGFRIERPQKSYAQLMQSELLKRFGPASVLINKKFEIVNFYGPTFEYFDLPQGDPVMNLISMSKEEIRTKLRAIAHKAIDRNETIVDSSILIKRDEAYKRIRLTFSPIRGKDVQEDLFLITFEEETTSEVNPQVSTEMMDGEDSLVKQLEAELKDTREDLQNTIEELETLNEELKASNEEMMSMNEELQSSNEELETSKEELQSLNEELNTVNTELCEKIDELETSNNDMINLMNSTDVATIFLDINATIRRFTPSARHLFHLIPSDIGRPIGDLAQRFHDEDLCNDTQKVIQTFTPATKEVKSDEGLWFIRRILPFLTQSKRFDGLVLTFTDITEIKKSEIAILEREKLLKENSELLLAILHHTHIMAVYLDVQFNFIWVNESYAKTCNHEPSFFKGKNHFVLYPHTENQKIFQKVIDTGESYFALAKPFEFPDQPERGITYWDWSLVPIKDMEGAVTGLVFTLVEVTERIRAEESLRESENRYRSLYNKTPVMLHSINKQGKLISVSDYWLYKMGYTREEVIGRPPSDFLSEKSRQYAIEFGLPEFFRTGVVKNISYQFVSKSGEIIETLFSAIADKDQNDNFVHSLAVILDITELKQMENALARNMKLLEEMERITHTGAWEYDVETKKQIWTDETYAIHDRDKNKYDPDHTEEISRFEPGSKEIVIKAFQDAISQGIPYDLDLEMTTIAGKHKWVRAICNPLVKSGKVIKLNGTVQDITEKKQTQKALINSEECLRFVLENSLDAAYRRNLQTDRYDYMSPVVKQVLGWSEEEMNQMDIQSVLRMIHPDDLPSILSEIERTNALCQSEGKATGMLEYRFRDKESNYRWVGDSITVISDARGKPLYRLGIIRDISERKLVEAELRQAKVSSEAANLAKSYFLANMSHEIRTPINVIIGMTTLLREIDLSCKAKEYVDMIFHSSEILLSLIEDILDFSKIEAGKIHLEFVDFDLKKLLDQTIDILKLKASEKSLLLKCQMSESIPHFLKGDSSRLRQVILNLVNNAIKFTPKGEIVIQVFQESESDTHITLKFSVTDTGIGIPTDRLKQLFKPFSQVDDSTTRNYGGTGLGLAISSKIVDLMGGQMAVSSVQGKGTTFYFTVSLERSKEIRETPCESMGKIAISDSLSSLNGIRILLAEDNQFNQKMETIILEKLGAHVEAVSNGKEAVEAASKGKFDIILMDIQMPVMDGLEAARTLRKEENDILIIALTANATIKDRENCYAAAY